MALPKPIWNTIKWKLPFFVIGVIFGNAAVWLSFFTATKLLGG